MRPEPRSATVLAASDQEALIEEVLERLRRELQRDRDRLGLMMEDLL